QKLIVRVGGALDAREGGEALGVLLQGDLRVVVRLLQIHARGERPRQAGAAAVFAQLAQLEVHLRSRGAGPDVGAEGVDVSREGAVNEPVFRAAAFQLVVDGADDPADVRL